jgi:hypothetical protein
VEKTALAGASALGFRAGSGSQISSFSRSTEESRLGGSVRDSVLVRIQQEAYMLTLFNVSERPFDRRRRKSCEMDK